MPRRLVNHEELGRLLAQTSGAISMIDDSHYGVRSKSGFNTYNVVATESEWLVHAPDYACYNAKCKHVYAVEFRHFYKLSKFYDDCMGVSN